MILLILVSQCGFERGRMCLVGQTSPQLRSNLGQNRPTIGHTQSVLSKMGNRWAKLFRTTVNLGSVLAGVVG